MSQYLQELCTSLCKVLNYSATLETRRFGGYVANLDFWISEIAHCLALIDGYAARRQKMMQGAQEAQGIEIDRAAGKFVPNIDSHITPNPKDAVTDWKALNTEADQLRKQVLRSAKRFLQHCLETQLITQDDYFRWEDQLGVRL